MIRHESKVDMRKVRPLQQQTKPPHQTKDSERGMRGAVSCDFERSGNPRNARLLAQEPTARRSKTLAREVTGSEKKKLKDRRLERM